MKERAKILACYNAPVSIYSVYNGNPLQETESGKDLSEKSFLKELNKVEKALSSYFTEVITLAIDRDVQKTINNIHSFNPDVIFNFVESVEGIASYEWCMAGLFSLLGYEYTGCSPSSLGNCLNKERTKIILQSRNVRTPAYIRLKVNARFTKKDITLKYPLMIKPLSEDASIGISEFSVVNDYSELRSQFKFLADTYKQDLIAEEYIKGRELNVAILGDEVLPVSEIDFTGLPSNMPKIVTYDGKWIEGSLYYNHTKPVCPAKLSDKVRTKVEALALEAFYALKCRDYARVDIRLNKNNVPYVIEVNPNPDISSDAGFTRAAAVKGINHSEVLYKIASYALNRKRKNDSQVKAS